MLRGHMSWTNAQGYSNLLWVVDRISNGNDINQFGLTQDSRAMWFIVTNRTQSWATLFRYLGFQHRQILVLARHHSIEPRFEGSNPKKKGRLQT